ncbi:hypothetical protein GUITHDRAFT_151653 [Guillardia theta CCMP2712]|uniref:Uncharacterized protein n=1 Tax=Guillardia theta (strain CCMP2712) TaxID=905079 RepID=L1JJK3_GUITC|nr:hypothetical protein GUITHDRAFT_151653 [Guillardia theta CCMP2712]EKX48681.1 hypothetical protein GUITHDRAFT_151653 [Guillardia theta CCMP2712]|eukprot:XP_005835661.1 hypothetical protein GUITHDRAFT_151653 [Guillardia theta CCMP2712]
MLQLLARLQTTKLLDGPYIGPEENWEHIEQFAQLCYNPTPSLVTLDPCSTENQNAGSFSNSPFYK